MAMILKTPIKSISELKQSPMKVFAEAKEKQTGVYILNNNQKKAVVLDVDSYENLVMEREALTDKVFYLETELRLQKNTKVYSDEEVRGNYQRNLSDLEDEWS